MNYFFFFLLGGLILKIMNVIVVKISSRDVFPTLLLMVLACSGILTF